MANTNDPNTVGEAKVEVTADLGGLKKNLEDAEKETEKSTKKMEDSFDRVGKGAEKSTKSVGFQSAPP